MTFCYDDSAGSGFISPSSIAKMNPHKPFLTHFSNSLYLTFIANNPLATPKEKGQARKELEIAERKMNFWRRHPDFSQEFASNECAKLKSQWRK